MTRQSCIALGAGALGTGSSGMCSGELLGQRLRSPTVFMLLLIRSKKKAERDGHSSTCRTFQRALPSPCQRRRPAHHRPPTPPRCPGCGALQAPTHPPLAHRPAREASARHTYRH